MIKVSCVGSKAMTKVSGCVVRWMIESRVPSSENKLTSRPMPDGLKEMEGVQKLEDGRKELFRF